MDLPGSLPCIERGTGRTVVFIHGYPLNHRIWLSQLESLSSECRVVLLDLPGYGLAESVAAPDRLQGFSEAVSRTLEVRARSPAVIVGHSLGGYVALQLYRDHPEQFQALVLTNTRSEGDSDEARERRLATASQLEATGAGVEVDKTVRSLVAESTWERQSPVILVLREIVRSARPAALVPTLRALARRPDLTPVLSTIRVPSLVVWGESDQLIPPSQTQSMVGRIPHAVGAPIPDAGHLPSMEAPSRFDDVLRAFLRDSPVH